MWKLKGLLARVVRNHVAHDHRLRLQHCQCHSDDLELFCVFCGVSLIVGSPALLNEIADCLVERGVSVYKINSPAASIRVH